MARLQAVDKWLLVSTLAIHKRLAHLGEVWDVFCGSKFTWPPFCQLYSGEQISVKFEWNNKIHFLENTFVNVCKMAAIFLRSLYHKGLQDCLCIGGMESFE